MGYVLIVAVYARTGAPPSTGAAWLTYGAARQTSWWLILTLSVATDLLYLPVAVAVYTALAPAARSVSAIAAGLLGGFVVLDLAVTWPNYAALIGLSHRYAAETDPARRAGWTAAADYASTVLSSRFEAFLSIGVPAAGILLAGVLMRSGPFRAAATWTALITGVLGLAAVVGPAISHRLDVLVILTSLTTTAWFLFTARDLHHLATTTQ